MATTTKPMKLVTKIEWNSFASVSDSPDTEAPGLVMSLGIMPILRISAARPCAAHNPRGREHRDSQRHGDGTGAGPGGTPGPGARMAPAGRGGAGKGPAGHA